MRQLPGGVTHSYPHLFAFCPHLLIAFLTVNCHLTSILNITYRQVISISYLVMQSQILQVNVEKIHALLNELLYRTANYLPKDLAHTWGKFLKQLVLVFYFIIGLLPFR